MPAAIIDGRAIASQIHDEIRRRLAAIAPSGRRPCLAGVLIGGDEGSRMYAASQARAAADLGMEHRLVAIDGNAAPASATDVLASLNADPAITGILLYQPLPKQVDLLALQAAIAPEKDVEGVHPANVGCIALGRPALAPCTAAAAIQCFLSTGLSATGRRAVVVGRSAIVGRPAALMLIGMDATVTVCHTRTRDLPAVCREAEVLIVAAGKPHLIGREHVRPGAVVIDVGTHRIRDADGQKMRTVGDVRTDEVMDIAAWITPVPGGVGPVTVAMLMQNLAVAECNRLSSRRNTTGTHQPTAIHHPARP